jgi:hypothetical protein
MDKKEEKALKRVQAEIKKIDKKENNVFFFILDTKGNPSGSLEYIYKLAMIAKNDGYKVGMLYQSADKNDKFVGVKDWLGEDYANIPHYDIASDDVEITPSDILFIPEIFANVMNQTKKLPCKRIAILQNYDYLVEQMPFAAQWGDFGILDAITNTAHNAELLKDIFPYVKTKVITPYIDKMFGTTIQPKKMIVNIVASNQEDINRIIKPFYWKYPSFKWVSFRDLRGFSKEQFAESLRDAAITIWVDDKTSFGYSALEAMKSGSIVIAKIPEEPLKWMNEDSEDKVGKLRNCCIWFDDFHEVQRAIASVVRSWITDKVPSTLFDEAKKVNELYPFETTQKEFSEYLNGIIENRKKEMEQLVNVVESKASKTDANE